MKETVKSVVRALATYIPEGAHAAILEGAEVDSWKLLRMTTPRCGVTLVGVDGRYGRIIGSVADGSVLPIYARTGRFAERTTGLVIDFLAGRGGLYVDVGSNIGLTTIPIAQDARVQCLAIEAAPLNFACLTANVAMNCPHHNVALRNTAVYNKRGTLDLQLSPMNGGDHRILTQPAGPGLMGEAGWSTVKVSAEPLDDIVSIISHPLVVKIDVQGAEPFVVEGGTRTLSAADLLVVEFAPYMLSQLGGDPSVVTSFLARTFTHLAIAEGEEGPIGEARPSAQVAEQLDAMFRDYQHDPTRYVDVIGQKADFAAT